VVEELERRGSPVEYLDGDTIRDIFPATGFTREDRDQHIRRVGYLASRLERHGVTVIASLVSPTALHGTSCAAVPGLAEVWIATPFEE
jgi:adenylylsulfate kinase